MLWTHSRHVKHPALSLNAAHTVKVILWNKKNRSFTGTNHCTSRILSDGLIWMSWAYSFHGIFLNKHYLTSKFSEICPLIAIIPLYHHKLFNSISKQSSYPKPEVLMLLQMSSKLQDSLRLSNTEGARRTLHWVWPSWTGANTLSFLRLICLVRLLPQLEGNSAIRSN